MSLVRIKATGRGRLSARLVIEGLEVEFVSAKRMEKTTSDGRYRVAGLDIATMKIGASADIMRATLQGESMTVKIKDLDRIAGKRHGRITRALWRSPSVRCFLSGNVTQYATSVALRDATGLPSSGVVHIGTEAIAYTSRTSTTLSCVGGRGAWDTIAQAHFTADGEGLSDALVTDQPIGVEGRRAILYLYGEGDDPQGDGTQRWLGVCASDVRWSGGVCEIAIDPITRLFDQPLGGDLSGRVTIRGIHYTSTSPWSLVILDATTSPPTTRSVMLRGYYESQGAFVEAANTAIAAVVADAFSAHVGDGYVRLVEQTDGYLVTYRTDSTTARPIYATVRSQLESFVVRDGTGYVGEITCIDRDQAWSYGGGSGTWGDGSWSPSTGTVYSYPVVADPARASLGRRGWNIGGAEDAGTASDFYRVYFGGLVTPNTNDALIFGSTDDDSRPARIGSFDSATRSGYIVDGIPGAFVVLTSSSELHLGRWLASGSFVDVLDNLVLSSPGYCNTGAMPLVTGASVTWETDVDAWVAESRLGQGRGFYLFEGGTTLAELLTPELLVCGIYPRIATDGRVEFFRISAPLSTDATVASIDDSAGPRPTIEKSPRGVLSQVVYRVGYDPRADEWDKRTLTFRDVQTSSATRTPITIEIAQRSTDTGSWSPSGSSLEGVSRDDVARVAMQHLGLFGMPTAVVTVTVDARYMDVRIGDVVSLSSSMLPDVEDGCSAIVSRTGLVVATSFELGTGRIDLGILMHTQRFAGYAPAFPVSSQSSLGSNKWQLTVSVDDYTPRNASAPYHSIAPWLEASDLVRVSRPDSAAADVLGTVVSVDSATTITVQFTSAWTPGAYSWALRARKSSEYSQDDRLGLFAFFGDGRRRLTYSDGDVDAEVFS